MAAKNYTEILALVNAGNQMGLSNTIKRDYGIPLDFTSVQPSYADAVIYAAENTKAYVGQPLSVGGKLYIINDIAAEAKYVVGEGDSAKEYDNYLVEVGSATEGDGVTIDLEEGMLTLHGFESALTGYLPRKAEDGKLEWVPISEVVKGDGNKVTTLTSEDDSVTITKKTDTDSSLVYDLSVEAYDDTAIVERIDDIEEAIGKEAKPESTEGAGDAEEATGLYKAIADAEARAKAHADANDADTQYDDTELTSRVSIIEGIVGKEAEGENAATGLVKAVAENAAEIIAVESRANAYTDAEIAGLKVSIEKIENVDYIVIRDVDEAEVSKVDASSFVKDSFLENVVYDAVSGNITFSFVDNTDEKSDIVINVKDLVDIYTAGIGLKVENNEFSVDTEVIATVEALNTVSKIAEEAQTAQEVSDAIDSKLETAFEDYYTSEEVEAKGYAVATEIANTYATKQDLIDHSNTMATTLNDYLKEADAETTYAKIGDSYTKKEVDDLIGAPGTPVEEDEEGNITKEAVPGTGVYQHVYSKNEVTSLIADITGGESAADVKAELTAYKTSNDTRVKATEDKNTSQDTAIEKAQEDAIQALADAKQANDNLAALTNGAVATNTSDIGAIKGRLTTLETAKGDHATRLATAEGKIASLETTTTNNSSAIGSLQGKDRELADEDTRLAGLIEGLTSSKANASDVYTKSETDTKVQAAIDAIPSLTGYATESYVDSAIEVVNSTVANKANASDVYTKEEADAEFMTQDEVDARISTLIDAANSEDTIKNVSDLVAYVNDNASDIAALVTTVESHTTSIGKNASAIAAINDTIAALVQPKASDEIDVAGDGELSIKEVNVNKLVQTEGDTLVLNGGNAGTKSTEIE